MGLEKIFIEKVIDGDTLNAPGDRILRLIGIDCPDFRMPVFDEAVGFVREAVEGQEVLVEYCPLRKLDSYNRERVVLFYKDRRGHNHNLNQRLLKLGLARFFPIAPCHIDFYEWARLEASARSKRNGIWSSERDEAIMDSFTLTNPEEDRELGVTKISNKFFKLGYFWSISDQSKIIYMLLCHMAHSSGIVWIAFTTIMKHTKYDVNTVLMALNELSSAGLIDYKISQNRNKPNYIILRKVIPPPKSEQTTGETQVETLDLF